MHGERQLGRRSLEQNKKLWYYNKVPITKDKANETNKKKGKERTSVFHCHGITPGIQIRNSQPINNFLSH